MATFIATGLWVIGGNMLMWLAALNNISPSVIEAAKIDGAGYFHRLLIIVIPLCTPILFYNLINGIIASLQTFDSYAMVGAGVDNSLYFIAVRIYVTGFRQMRMGLACAEAWLLFVLVAVCTLIMFRFPSGCFMQTKKIDRKQVRNILVLVLRYILLAVFALFFIFPYFYMLTRSLMSLSEVNSPNFILFPSELHFENYAIVGEYFPYLWNTLVVVVINGFFIPITGAMIAFPFARYRFRAKGSCFLC